MIIVCRCLLLVVAGLAFVDAIDDATVNCTDVRINDGPLITPCVSAITLQKGQNFTLTCKGNTKLRFRQQDVSEEVTSNFTIVNTSWPISKEGYSFQRTLQLYNIDQYAIGYYACSDESVNENIVNTITEEPENTEHVSYIYVYVNGTDSLFAPMTELIMSKSNKILIECRPTTPDVEVKISSSDIAENVDKRYSPKVGFVLNYDINSYTRLNAINVFICDFSTEDRRSTKYVYVTHAPIELPVPHISHVPIRFLKGDDIILNCTVYISRNTIVKLSWTFQHSNNTAQEEIKSNNTNTGNVTEGEIFNTLTIPNATEKHAGNYICVASNTCDHKESNVVIKEYIPKPYLNPMRIKSGKGMTRQKYISMVVELDGHPAPNVTVLKNGKELELDPQKYNLTHKYTNYDFALTIKPINVADTANYTFIADNGVYNTSVSYNAEVAAAPVISFGVSDKTCVKDTVASFKCDVSGYPLPSIRWIFSSNGTKNAMDSNNEHILSEYNKTAVLNLPCSKTGVITCMANNKIQSNVSESRKLLVFEINNGFGVISNHDDNRHKWVVENDQVKLKCLASLYTFSNVTWVISEDKSLGKTVEYQHPTEFSHVAELKINHVTLNDTGSYKCIGVKNDGSEVYDSIQINVSKLQAAIIVDNINDDIVLDVYRFETQNLNCTTTGVPLPTVKWFLDGEPLIYNETNVFLYENVINRTTVNSTVEIKQMQPTNVGKYMCVATSGNHTQQKKYFTVNQKVEEVHSKTITRYLIAIAAIVLILIVLIVYLSLKIKKEKQFRKELAAAGLLYFKEGVINSLNPDLGIDEQAELLPYDEKFEFPPEKLVYGKQLGAGAFGVVYKAEARGIINAEETTTVAVKMVKKTADNMYIKALASELKIMVHLGKHINIVNLLGACTKNVGKRELVVIVEYCKYGNIHNYMQRHREVFIDQLDTDNKEKLGKVNRAYTSTSCGSTGVQSDYFGSTNTQDTDNTFLNTANTAHSVRKNIPKTEPMDDAKASEGYVPPEWRSNYESDYSYDGRSPRPLTSRDLLAWAFQIARGMEYLASRKVLHGDLAARNILLADDNIVKICDFGLAKSIYKNDEYKPKHNCPLPVKWLAIECIADRIFSTQSDVWSFGIVLWELFSLAKTPYPNVHPPSLLQFLSEGHRLDKPAYADDRLYDVMNKCWEAKPTLRPTFSQLQELLGTFLEDNVRNHYVDLNSSYMDKNAKVQGQEDYLDMMCAPDYNNMVTPSPHHYVNAVNDRSFFPPTPVKVDEEGYLKMSPTNKGPFSPRLPNSEFDFDPRKFNPKTTEASSCGSELTPMLTLNNLPARSGSESDHEGNAPYLTVCSRIDEEADEVFAPTTLETKNAKNMQQSAVTNPTYITFDNIDEKPKDITNSYVNINVPNGLVK